jgi:hypothetical protein
MMLPTSFHFEFRHSLFDILIARFSVFCRDTDFMGFTGSSVNPDDLRSFASDSRLSGCTIHVPLVFLVFLLLGLASVDVFCQFYRRAAMAADHWPIPPFFGGDFGSQIHYET